jgi:hypothetical protein
MEADAVFLDEGPGAAVDSMDSIDLRLKYIGA